MKYFLSFSLPYTEALSGYQASVSGYPLDGIFAYMVYLISVYIISKRLFIANVLFMTETTDAAICNRARLMYQQKLWPPSVNV